MKELTRKTIFIVLIILTILGLVLALQSFKIYKTGKGYCPGTHEETVFPGTILPEEQENTGALPLIETGGETSSCVYLYSRPESRIAGLHLSELAPIYFSTLLVVLMTFYFKNNRVLKVALGILYIVGLLAVPYLVYLEMKLDVICFYCTIMHLVIIILNIIYIYGLRNNTV